ncbi:choline/ethanolamine kinase [Penicillium verhagenii]|uniref:choline/ethanolamine kinase n=1 Tax=Penicillium verhagenii TaxID=1562060 RepID=UPI00254561E5|nr:choline/ethanolamine kinase [Penicillium verhagenii]KAJ5939081.1 choline/ethanolamine kinase [Penicillium verhagenii]
MATCISIPVTIPEDRTLTKAMIQEIVSFFFTNEWPSVDPETLTVVHHSGYANTNCVVERPKPNNGTHSEPLKLFLKINGELDGEIAVFKHLVPNKHEEAQLCYDYGQSGLGAKLYGFFQTQDGAFGRVDEFWDARNLEPEDVEDTAIRADIAKGHAVFHTMETQLPKKPIQLYYEAIIGKLTEYHKLDKLKRLANEGGVSLDDLVDYDFVSRIRQVTDRLESIGGKRGWCIHDVQFMNVLVKESPKEGESKIALIDFEFVFQNYRAFDIGGHFLHKMFKWFDKENKIANCRPYSEEEKRHFCHEYAQRWNEITGDSDTGEQVFQEAELGYLLSITFEVHNMLCFMYEEEENDPLELLGFKKLFEEFVNQYKKLGLES